MSDYWDDIHAQSLRDAQRMAQENQWQRDRMHENWVKSMTRSMMHYPAQYGRILSHPARVMLPQGI